MKKIIILFVMVLFLVSFVSAVYDLPDGACPDNCRKTTWDTGSDIWNNGLLPVYPVSTTLNPGATLAQIQTALNNAASGTAVYLNAGTYALSGSLTIPSNKVLRGAGAKQTIITGVVVSFGSSTSLSPSTSYAVHSGGYSFSGSPIKGDTTLTLQTSTQANVGDWIAIFSDDDPSFVDNGGCGWCSDNTGYHLMQQIVQVTDKSGSLITISKPLYYTLYINPQFRVYTIPNSYAGIEDLKLDSPVGLTPQLAATTLIS